MSSTTRADGFVRVASLADIEETSPQSVTVDGRSIGLFYHDDAVYAVANQCPHMGFPLTRGSVEDGILTCHWHHARFELTCGDTFDPWADDVETFPIEIRDGEVWLHPDPPSDEAPVDHWARRLDDGLRENLSLVIAKAVIGLADEDTSATVPLRAGVEFGTQYRAGGWGSGLTTLGVMANLLDHVDQADRRRALYTGLVAVANDCAGESPFFEQHPLRTQSVGPARLTDWFRENIEVRDADGAERVLRAAISVDLPAAAIADMLVAAATDHRYLDTGHSLDFINKAFEVLDHIGWDSADTVLPTLVPGLASANRAEENSAWRKPIDIAELLSDTYEFLPDVLGAQPAQDWTEPDDLVDTLLGDDPQATITALLDAIRNGANAPELAETVSYAAVRRIAQFGTSNEFSDWNTVHHTFSYANAVRELAARTTSWEVYRGVFDAAMSVYLDRFLNMPPSTIPEPVSSPRDPGVILDELDTAFETEGVEQVAAAGRLTAEFVDADGDIAELKRRFGHVLMREDAGFHPNQNLEAAFTQHDRLADPTRRRVTLIAAARFLAAHTPTRREREQTYRIAERLNRGEKIHEE